MRPSVPTIAARVGLLAHDVQVRTACAPPAWPSSIDAWPSTPVKAGSTSATMRSGVPSTIDAQATT
jgi:hypothetical protein